MIEIAGGLTVVNFILINAALALSIYVTLYTGLLTVANAGFMAIGAYAGAVAAVRFGLPPPAALPAAMIAAAALAWMLGRLVLRLRDVYLAIATLGFGEIVRIAILNGDKALSAAAGAPVVLLRGAEGMTLPYHAPAIVLGLPLDTWWMAIYLAGTAWLVAALQASRFGRVLASIRMDESAAATLGIDVVRGKLAVFVLGAAIAAGAGVLSAPLVRVIHPGSYTFSRAVDILAFGVLGGMYHWTGPILGAVVLTWLPEALRFLQDRTTLVNGVIIMLSIIFLPRGLADGRAWRYLAGGMGRRPAPAAPAADLAAVRPAAAAAPAAASVPILTVEDLTCRFGGLVALDRVSFEIGAGTITALIGPNGAGKTTLINVLSGVTAPASGRVRLGGVEVTGRSPAAMARLGVARTFQNIRLFPDLPVLENVMLGLHRHRRGSVAAALLRTPASRAGDRRAREEAMAILGRIGLSAAAAQPAGALSYGDQRRVEIARALATGPRLLLLDEPAAGMNPAETARLGDRLREIAAGGVTVVLIEHDMALVQRVSDRVVVLNFGRRIAEGTPEAIQRDPVVIEAYLGAPEP